VPRASHPPEKPIARAVAAAFGAATSVAPRQAALPPALLARRRERAEQRMVEALEARGTGVAPKDLAAQLRPLAKAWAERGFDDRFDDAARFEERCFEEGELARARATGDASAAVEAAYRRAIVEEYGRIEIRGLQMSERVYQDLETAYVPLWVLGDSRKAKVIETKKGWQVKLTSRLTLPELVSTHECAALVGAPGSGKSTVVAYLAVQAALGKLSGFRGAEDVVPFVVAVRSLRGSVLDEEAIAAGATGIGVDFVVHVLSAGRGLVLLDGLDEAQEGAPALLPSLQHFADAHPGNRILVTTRPAAALGDQRPRIPGFAVTTLAPMGRDDVYDFIGKWCEAAELSIQKDQVKAREDAQRAAEDLEARVQASRPVERLAQTPLMCSVLCIVHRFLGQRIPERRVALYEACTNVLLYEWDRAKFPAGAAVGKLDAQEKKVLLGGLARWMHEEKLAEVPHEDVVRVFAERLPWVRHEPEEATSIVGEIRDRSGILLERRPGFFAFSHLTFQEYLAATEIVRAGDILALVPRFNDRWWHEVVVLAAGHPNANAAGLILGLLRADPARDSFTATLLAAQCTDVTTHLASSVRERVQKRLATVVPPKSDEAVDRLVYAGEVAGPVLMGALRRADALGRAHTCIALGRLNYEPAANALASLMLDEELPSASVVAITYALDRTTITFDGSHVPVALFAALALFNMAVSFVEIRPIFEQAIRIASYSATSIFRMRIEDDLGPAARAYLKKIRPIVTDSTKNVGHVKLAARSD
jgi:NACHT domain